MSTPLEREAGEWFKCSDMLESVAEALCFGIESGRELVAP